MTDLEVSLIEWPEGRAHGGPRLLGTSSNPELVSQVREQLAAERRRELTKLEGPVRLVPPPKPEPVEQGES